MAYKNQKISPSWLATAELCPRSRPDGEDTQAGVDGTLMHETLEEMVSTVPRSQWESWVETRESLSPFLKGSIQVIVAKLREIIIEDLPAVPNAVLKMRNGKPRKTLLKPGLYTECQIDRGQGRHGYIDLMVVTDEGLVYIIDYKSNRAAKDFSLQLAAYASDVHRLCPAHERFICQIIAPNLDEEENTRLDLDLDALAKFEERIARIEELADRSANDPSVAGNPGPQCEHCHWKGSCPYQCSAALTVAESTTTDLVKVSDKKGKVTVIQALSNLIGPNGPYAGEIVDATTFTNPTTPAQRGLRRACMKFLEVLIEQAKKDDASYLSEFPEDACKDMIPGFSISFRNGRSSTKGHEGDVRNAVMEAFGLSIEDVFECSTVDKDTLVEFVHIHQGVTKKAAEEKYKKAIAKYETPGGRTAYWTQKVRKIDGTNAEFIDA